MGSKVDVPATTDPTSTDWQNFIAWVEKAQTGKINITFSNMDNTSEPKIQAGSIVEIAGSLYSFSTEEAATGWTAIANDTQAYMALTASGDTVSAEWTTTAPVYRDDLQGWYESGTNKRYVLRCYKVSDTSYTAKSKYQQEYGNKYFDGAIHLTNMGSREYTSNTTSATVTIPEGVYMVRIDAPAGGQGGVRIITSSGSPQYLCYAFENETRSTFVISDGINATIETGAGSLNYRYLKLSP